MNSNEYAAAGIFPRYLQFQKLHPKLQSSETDKAVMRIINTIRNEKRVPSKGLALYGEPGTGKTGSIMIVAKAATELQAFTNKKITVACYSFWDFITYVRNSFGNRHDNQRERETIADLAHNNDIIFLDDLGKCKANLDWLSDAFQELVDRVYNHGTGKALFITSNLAREGLAEVYGNPCLDRLDEICYPITITGQSLRTT